MVNNKELDTNIEKIIEKVFINMYNLNFLLL